MKLLIRIVAGLVGLWVILMLVGFVLPGHYRVQRSTVIAAPPSTVYPFVGDLKAWSKWGVWFKRDPDMQIAYSPVTTEVGSWSQWKSKSQGNGRMTISTLHPSDDFEYRMDFTDMAMVSHGAMVLASGPGGTTTVTMSMDGDLSRNPMHRWFGLFMDKLVGPDFEAGLANLKTLSEAH